jgi:hypothetical protein
MAISNLLVPSEFFNSSPGLLRMTYFVAQSVDRPIVFDLRSIGEEYWKNHICVINEALECCHLYVNYFRRSRLFLILMENQSCVLPRVSDGPGFDD